MAVFQSPFIATSRSDGKSCLRGRRGSGFRTARPVAVLAIFLLAAGCASGPPDSRRAPTAGAAELAYRDGRFYEAAELFAREATGVSNDDVLWLRAADSAWRAGEVDLARFHLAACDRRDLSIPDQALFDVLWVAVDERPPPHRVLESLGNPVAVLPDAYRPLHHELRARALVELGQPYRSALERVELDRMLLGVEERHRNRELIVSALQRLESRKLAEYVTAHRPGDDMFGWITLVAMLKAGVYSGQSADAILMTWRSRFPDHPANLDGIDALLSAPELGFSRPQRIALLLPLSSPRLRRAALAVRDGFVSAYIAEGQSGEVVLLDTAGDPRQAVGRYHQAMAEGASQIVGPLDKDAVTAVLLEADGTVPVLALNYSESDAPIASAVFQFGLQPEEDARAAAERMLADGNSRAVMLTPGDGWGQRMEIAFAERFNQLGGTVLGSYRYNPGEVDHGAVVQQVVGTTDARIRSRQLERVIGESLSVDPQPRHDIDALFLAARSPQARQIKPQLAFYNAGDLPTYGTSHAYGGHSDPNADRDLNGLRFCDSPWVLGSQVFSPPLDAVRNRFEAGRSTNVRLLAVGFDAYRVLPYLDWLSRYRNDSFPGFTGQLSVDGGGRLRRRLDCAVFRGGVAEYDPRPLDYGESRG